MVDSCPEITPLHQVPGFVESLRGSAVTDADDLGCAVQPVPGVARGGSVRGQGGTSEPHDQDQ